MSELGLLPSVLFRRSGSIVYKLINPSNDKPYTLMELLQFLPPHNAILIDIDVHYKGKVTQVAWIPFKTDYAFVMFGYKEGEDKVALCTEVEYLFSTQFHRVRDCFVVKFKDIDDETKDLLMQYADVLKC